MSTTAVARVKLSDPTWSNELLRYDREGERSQAQQETRLSTCLSDIVSVGRPVCSTGTTSGSKLPGTSHVYISRHGKPPPV